MGHCFVTELEVRHRNLRSLSIIDNQGYTYFRLSCPALNELTIQMSEIPRLLLQSLTSICPILRRLHLFEVYDADAEAEAEGERQPLELYHKTLELLEVECVARGRPPMRIISPNLGNLYLSSEAFWEREPESLSCPKVVTIKLGYCPYVSRVPSIVSVFPILRLLKVSASQDDSWVGVEGE